MQIMQVILLDPEGLQGWQARMLEGWQASFLILCTRPYLGQMRITIDL